MNDIVSTLTARYADFARHRFVPGRSMMPALRTRRPADGSIKLARCGRLSGEVRRHFSGHGQRCAFPVPGSGTEAGADLG